MLPRITWWRGEPFGAWVRLDDATLIAVDRALADRLGLPGFEAPSERPPTSAPRPLELHIAVTSRCPARCDGCYMDARPEGEDPPLDVLFGRLAEARAAGVSTVAFGGGEPLVRSDLGRIAERARELGLVPVMTTSGLGLTAARAGDLKAFAQINVSHDGALGAYRDVRGWDGSTTAERAIELLSGAGIPVGVNVALTRATFERLSATAARAADLGAGELQLLRYKPGGRAADPSYAERRLTPEQTAALWPAIEAIVRAGRLRVRIDCAMVPLLSTSLLAVHKDAARALSALGVFGCEAARHLGGMRIDGEHVPCSFFSVDSLGGHGHQSDRRSLPLAPRPSIAGLRAYHASLPEPCASCALVTVCRGGCQVVSLHTTRTTDSAGGSFAPDPECPRVRSFAAGAAPVDA